MVGALLEGMETTTRTTIVHPRALSAGSVIVRRDGVRYMVTGSGVAQGIHGRYVTMARVDDGTYDVLYWQKRGMTRIRVER